MRRFVTVTAMLAATAIAAQTPTKEQEKPFIQDYVKAVIGAPPAPLGADPFYKKYAARACALEAMRTRGFPKE
jgi:hypothetical protein